MTAYMIKSLYQQKTHFQSKQTLENVDSLSSSLQGSLAGTDGTLSKEMIAAQKSHCMAYNKTAPDFSSSKIGWFALFWFQKLLLERAHLHYSQLNIIETRELTLSSTGMEGKRACVTESGSLIQIQGFIMTVSS
ncbi:MAG: hypothetical protein EZS28_000966 [Streblomastix strix]|uniref:Uncharacterized protein n=1 Tax=Streblomastix strix TaxID=222440 RepID=A0A5J4X8D0_9EUKA|nr:MAG: hypothetical protein EZS28_000966 [Streblomastix strix]